MNTKKLIASLILLSILPTAHADMRLSQYKDLKERKEDAFIDIYLLGVADGFQYANTELKINNKPMIYCQPENLILENDNIIRIVNKQVAKFEKERASPGMEDFRNFDISIALLLKKGLKETFPCDN